MKNNRLINQLLKMLPKHEQVKYEASETGIDVTIDGKPKFYIRESGGITFPENMPFDDTVYKLHDEIVRARECVSEYLFAMDNAADLKARDFNMPYKKLLEYNGVVLGGVETKDGEYNFTTWSYANNSLYHGHYHGTDYEKAKEDFVTRSGLVDENRLFSEKELAEIYKCATEALEFSHLFDDEYVKALNNVREKITNAVPDVRELDTPSNGQGFEQSI